MKMTKAGGYNPSAFLTLPIKSAGRKVLKCLKQTQLARHINAQVLIRQPCRHASAWRAVEKANLDQKRLVDLFERILFLGQRRGERVQAHGAAIVFFDDRP